MKSRSDNPSDMAISFEGLKVAMRQTKEGYALTLLVHPDDAPSSLFHGRINQRYMVALVAIGDQEDPVPQHQEKNIDNKSQDRVSYSGRLCREPLFWEYLTTLSDPFVEIASAEDAADEMRNRLGVSSRVMLAQDGPHVEAFDQLCADYRAWAGIAKDLR